MIHTGDCLEVMRGAAGSGSPAEDDQRGGVRDLPPSPARLVVVPCELAMANRFVALHHRHHKPAVGHRFSLAVVDEVGVLHGVAIVGRPVARMVDARSTLEVTRLCTDGTRNACSMLYAAAARAGKAMGYMKIQTYVLAGETGVSLSASGWVCKGVTGGGQWKHTDGRKRRTDQPTGLKHRWERPLNGEWVAIAERRIAEAEVKAGLFG
jgi:hypothetical protein